MYYYVVTLGILALVVMFLACCFGSIIFFGGSFVSLKFIEEILQNMDKIPGMMRPKDDENKKDDFYPGEEEHKDEPKNPEEVFR